MRKNNPKILKKGDHQTGRSNKKIDKEYKAMPPGKRESSSGNIYYEYRRNRSDLKDDSPLKSGKKSISIRNYVKRDGTKVSKHNREIEITRGSMTSIFKTSNKGFKIGDEVASGGYKFVIVSFRGEDQAYLKGSGGYKVTALEDLKHWDEALKEVKKPSEKSERNNWEERVERVLAQRLNIPGSDAQGIMMAFKDDVDKAWLRKASPLQTAIRLQIKSKKDESQDYKGYYIEHDKYQDWFNIRKEKGSKKYLGAERSLEEAKKYVDKLVVRNNKANKIKDNIKDYIKVGDIFYTSWGYDQTNYDYLAVIEISPSGKSVVCQMTQYEHVGVSGQSNIQKPVLKPFGEKFRMQVQVKGWSDEPEVTLRGSYPYVQGSRRLDTFWKAKKGETFYETDSQFGH